MHKILRGACIALGLACFGASYYLYNNFINPPEIVQVQDNNFHIENTDDGTGTVKLVMLKGKVKPYNKAVDSGTGVEVNYPVLQRKVQMYQYFLKDDVPMVGWKDTQIKNFKDKKGKEFKNPAFPSKYKSVTYYSDIKLGDGRLPISFVYMQRLLKKYDYEKSFYYLKNVPRDQTPEGFQWKGNHYLKSSTPKPRVGDLRIFYRVLNHEELPELTIIGQQTDRKVKLTNADCRFYNTPVTMEEINKSYGEDAPHAALAAVLFGAFFVLLGVFKGDR